MSRAPLSTHVLDTSSGRPGAGVALRLLRRDADDSWLLQHQGRTSPDGRHTDFPPAGSMPAGTYKLNFDTGAYYREKGVETLYPFVEIVFEFKEKEHYHIPLLISPYGYSTYRGS